jgi:oxygen-independent coproporphyrinogen-3 oxidase
MAGLYVHIPFCSSKCAYCDFFSSPKTDLLQRVVVALGAEWQMRKSELREPLQTIYIGGGTPSLLSTDLFARLAKSLHVSADIDEFTIEANPDDISPALVDVWRANGVGRVSMGIQSFDDAQLQSVGRRHSAQQAVDAVNTLRSHGIDNLSLDLIYGLPGQTLQSWQQSLNKLLSLHPQHFSAYMLSYEPGTRLYAQLISGKVAEADDDLIEAMYTYLCDAARAAGYEHYEISNFALPGHRAVHNSNYWRFLPYVGLGPSAHSFDGTVRRVNPANIKQYLQKIEGGEVAADIEEETDLNRLNDMIMVGLRTADGLDLNSLPQSEIEPFCKRLKMLPPDHIIVDGMRVYIPEHRYLVSDAIIRTLLAD